MADTTASEAAQKFVGIPMSELIAGPLIAVCESQMRLAEASYEYMMKIGFDDKGNTCLIEFDLDRPGETVGGYQSVKTHVQAPFLALVPVPSLLVDNVAIEFQMEISATETAKSSSGNEVSTITQAKYGFLGLGGSTNISGKVTSARENTRSTNQSAKYQVRVNAKQMTPSEGLSRLMDILASSTQALPASSNSV